MVTRCRCAASQSVCMNRTSTSRRGARHLALRREVRAFLSDPVRGRPVHLACAQRTRRASAHGLLMAPAILHTSACHLARCNPRRARFLLIIRAQCHCAVRSFMLYPSLTTLEDGSIKEELIKCADAFATNNDLAACPDDKLRNVVTKLSELNEKQQEHVFAKRDELAKSFTPVDLVPEMAKMEGIARMLISFYNDITATVDAKNGTPLKKGDHATTLMDNAKELVTILEVHSKGRVVVSMGLDGTLHDIPASLITKVISRSWYNKQLHHMREAKREQAEVDQVRGTKRRRPDVDYMYRDPPETDGDDDVESEVDCVHAASAVIQKLMAAETLASLQDESIDNYEEVYYRACDLGHVSPADGSAPGTDAGTSVAELDENDYDVSTMTTDDEEDVDLAELDG